MSLCYDFQKWTILTLGLVAISLSVGLLMQVVNGYVDGNNNGKDDVLETWDSMKNKSIVDKNNNGKDDRVEFLVNSMKDKTENQPKQHNNSYVDGNNNGKDDRLDMCVLSFSELYVWNGSTCELDERKYQNYLKSNNLTQ